MAIAGKRHGRARTWQHVAMAQKKCVEEARGTPKYLADIVCAANVVAKKRTRIAANRLCWLETRIAGCYRLDSRSIFSQLDRFVHYPRTLFRSEDLTRQETAQHVFPLFDRHNHSRTAWIRNGQWLPRNLAMIAERSDHCYHARPSEIHCGSQIAVEYAVSYPHGHGQRVCPFP